MCYSKPDQTDKDKIILDPKGKYSIFIGAAGPCKVSLNVGGKMFRAHHDELAKGILSGGELSISASIGDLGGGSTKGAGTKTASPVKTKK
jgi:hypothetical protein